METDALEGQPGTYRLAIEPIDPTFVGGSSVGPYALSVEGRSFDPGLPIQMRTECFRRDDPTSSILSVTSPSQIAITIGISPTGGCLF